MDALEKNTWENYHQSLSEDFGLYRERIAKILHIEQTN